MNMLKKVFLIFLCLRSVSVLADTQFEMVQSKVDRLEAELALVQRKIYQQPTKTQLGTSGDLSDLYTQIDAQNQVVQDLTKKVENLNHQLNEVSEKLARLNADVDFRFQELNPQNKKEEAAQKIVRDVSDQEAYDKAYSLLKDGKYTDAEQLFLVFMEKYPNSSLLPNANYWLGESYYARGLLPEASGFFADGFTKYKESSKAADSMFKLGLTMKQMGKTKEACTAFLGLSKEFKNLSDNLKKRSQQEMKELKCS